MKQEPFSKQELERYARHLCLPRIGLEGQRKLKQSSVLIVGLGGLGSSLALLMATAGIGTIGLLDDDIVKLGNLPRQVLYTYDDIGDLKAVAAEKRLCQRNPEVLLRVYCQKLLEDNAEKIIRDFDLVLDGTDNLSARRIINQACVHHNKPYIYGAVDYFDGQVSVFWKGKGPCLNCLYPLEEKEDLYPNETLHGVLSTLPTLVSTIQATEAIKIITGAGKPLIGRLLIIDGLNGEFQNVAIKNDQNCEVCGLPQHN